MKIWMYRSVRILLVWMIVIGVAGGLMAKQLNPLIEADRALNREYALSGNLAKAIATFLHPGGIVLPMDGEPLIGITAINDWEKNTGKATWKAGKISWEPKRVYISPTDTFGYTYGQFKKMGWGLQKPVSGYYCTVWLKNKKGKWKIFFSQGLFQLKIKGDPNRPVFNEVKASQLTGLQKTLLDADVFFPKYAKQYGISAAFHQFIADDGIAVGDSGPAATKETYRQLMITEKKQSAQVSRTLAWRPVFSYLDSSAVIGFNTGPYTMTVVEQNGRKRKLHGYFFSIWKREKGEWRFVYDGGNRVSDKKAQAVDYK